MTQPRTPLQPLETNNKRDVCVFVVSLFLIIMSSQQDPQLPLDVCLANTRRYAVSVISDTTTVVQPPPPPPPTSKKRRAPPTPPAASVPQRRRRGGPPPPPPPSRPSLYTRIAMELHRRAPSAGTVAEFSVCAERTVQELLRRAALIAAAKRQMSLTRPTLCTVLEIMRVAPSVDSPTPDGAPSTRS